LDLQRRGQNDLGLLIRPSLSPSAGTIGFFP
jgi:hypothetical protein